MFCKFKIGDYFFYKYKRDLRKNSWMVCKITEIVELDTKYHGDYNPSYFKYEVISTSNTCIVERVDSRSMFGKYSPFHNKCVKVKSLDDSTLLSIIL